MSFWVDRLRVLVEVLSRLVVRLDGEQAIAAFRKAVSLAHAPDWRYWALFEPLGNLLNRASLGDSASRASRTAPGDPESASSR